MFPITAFEILKGEENAVIGGYYGDLILFSLNLFTNLDNELLDLLKANISTLKPKFNKKSIHSTSKSSKCFLDSFHMKTKSISSPLFGILHTLQHVAV